MPKLLPIFYRETFLAPSIQYYSSVLSIMGINADGFNYDWPC